MLEGHAVERVIHDQRIQLIDPTVASVTIGDVIPNGRPREADRSIVLGSRHQPFPGSRITGHVFDLSDAESFAEGRPGCAAICRAVNSPVVACVNNLGIVRGEGQTMLVWMDAVVALGGDVGPAYRGAADAPTVGIDGANVNLVLIVWRGGNVPVIPRLIDVEPSRCSKFSPSRSNATPQMRGGAFSGKSKRDGRHTLNTVDSQPCQIARGPGWKSDRREGISGVGRHEKAGDKRREDFHRSAIGVDADVPTLSRSLQAPPHSAIGRFVKTVGGR